MTTLYATHTSETVQTFDGATRAALATFLAAEPAERARLWRAMAARNRRLLVGAMLIQAFDDWSEESVELWVARYDARWGSEPNAADRMQASMPSLTALEAAQAGALETIATQADAALRAATEASDRTHWRRELNAANKALAHFLDGVRPQRTPDGAWLLASATKAGAVYRIGSTGCSCPAGVAGASCWHISLIAGVEAGYDSVDLVEIGTPDADDVADLPEPIDLGQRIAAARVLLLVA